MASLGAAVQVQALCSLPSGGVPATYLNSQQTDGEKGAVYRELGKDHPTCKLLYVTPEQFANSQLLIEKLTRLYHLGLMSLFCVDEVGAQPCADMFLGCANMCLAASFLV